MYVNVCFQSGQSNNGICLFPMCKRSRDVGQWLLPTAARAWVSIGGGQSPFLSHGWVCDFFFFFKPWVCESVAILVLIWYWFVNFLRVNLFCNFLIKKCHIIKKSQVIVPLAT